MLLRPPANEVRGSFAYLIDLGVAGYERTSLPGLKEGKGASFPTKHITDGPTHCYPLPSTECHLGPHQHLHADTTLSPW